MTDADHGRVVLTADPDDLEHAAEPPGGPATIATEAPTDTEAGTMPAAEAGTPGWELPTGQAVVRALGGAMVVGLAASALLARRRAAPPELQAGESLAVSVRPRKVVMRYLLSLGMWELDRRATRFSVTDRRLLVEQGLLHRVVMAVPLSAIQNVLVRTGPWEGWVNVSLPSSQGGATRIGPLRSGSARRFAAAINRHGGAPVDEIEE